MSNEAMTWALNLAPVPLDASGTPSGACAAVLVGLANHADPDGCNAFPAVSTLVRYTRLSERTVRYCLDRLESIGVIRPSSETVLAAKIPRADRRPKGYDLDLARVRDDLSIQEMERVAAANKFLKPIVSEWLKKRGATDARGATDDITGCNRRTNGVQLTTSRGAAAAPEPYIEPSLEPSKKKRATSAPQSPDLFEKPEKPGKCVYSAYVEYCASIKKAVVDPDHSVFTWAQTVGLPETFLSLAWSVFDQRFRTDEKAKTKKYTAWPQVFENYVKRNWLELWGIDREGTYYLTVIGKQAEREFAEIRKAA